MSNSPPALFVAAAQSSSDRLNLRSSYPYTVPICKKSRYGRDIIPYCIGKKY